MSAGLQREEIEIDGVKFYLIDRDLGESTVCLRSAGGGATVTRTNQCIIIGIYEFANVHCKYAETGMSNLKVVEFARNLRKFKF